MDGEEAQRWWNIQNLHNNCHQEIKVHQRRWLRRKSLWAQAISGYSGKRHKDDETFRTCITIAIYGLRYSNDDDGEGSPYRLKPFRSTLAFNQRGNVQCTMDPEEAERCLKIQNLNNNCHQWRWRRRNSSIGSCHFGPRWLSISPEWAIYHGQRRDTKMGHPQKASNVRKT